MRRLFVLMCFIFSVVLSSCSDISHNISEEEAVEIMLEENEEVEEILSIERKDNGYIVEWEDKEQNLNTNIIDSYGDSQELK